MILILQKGGFLILQKGGFLILQKGGFLVYFRKGVFWYSRKGVSWYFRKGVFWYTSERGFPDTAVRGFPDTAEREFPWVSLSLWMDDIMIVARLTSSIFLYQKQSKQYKLILLKFYILKSCKSPPPFPSSQKGIENFTLNVLYSKKNLQSHEAVSLFFNVLSERNYQLFDLLWNRDICTKAFDNFWNIFTLENKLLSKMFRRAVHSCPFYL